MIEIADPRVSTAPSSVNERNDSITKSGFIDSYNTVDASQTYR